MPATASALEDVGLYTLTDLATRTGVPRRTLRTWVRADRLAVVKIDGVLRSTVPEVRRAAERARRDGRGRPRSWALEPADTDERVAV
jgi:hypothetical protein